MTQYTVPPSSTHKGYTMHIDKDVCDVGDGCDLPTTEQERARDRADSRNDWYVIVPGVNGMLGPVSRTQANQAVLDARESGHKPKLLRVVEDYKA
jgi:hypothetical protein